MFDRVLPILGLKVNARQKILFKPGPAVILFLLLMISCQSTSPSALPDPASPAAVLSRTDVPIRTPLSSTPQLPSSPAPLPTAAVPSASPSPLPSNSPAPLLPSPTTDVPIRTPQPTTTLLFTGQIVMARCVQAGIDARGSADYIFDSVHDLISGADLAIGTLNSSISDVPPHTGCTDTFVLVGGSANADALARAGFDAMSVATNHIKHCGLMTCGDRAFLDTLANLQRVNILPVGAGRDLAEALRPVVLTADGVRFGIVSLGQIEPRAFAGPQTPGIAVLNPENLGAAIKAARQISDVVIFMPHWGPEYVAVPNWIQRNLARQAVAAGADLVVGNHTHVVQAQQVIDGVQVFYGLGNFVFDQYWQAELRESVILKVKFEGKRYLGYELVPVYSERDGTLHLADAQEAAEILERIEQASAALK